MLVVGVAFVESSCAVFALRLLGTSSRRGGSESVTQGARSVTRWQRVVSCAAVSHRVAFGSFFLLSSEDMAGTSFTMSLRKSKTSCLLTAILLPWHKCGVNSAPLAQGRREPGWVAGGFTCGWRSLFWRCALR